MNTRKFGRTALIAVLALSIIMSITGGTIAWFTDEVTSAGNKIEAGNLDITLEYKDETGAWKNVEDDSAPLFSYNKWEPGYATYKYFRIANAGNLALKYQLSLNIDPATEEAQFNLADVIDVYLLPGDTVVTREVLANTTPVSTLAELAIDPDGAARGYLLPAGNDEGESASVEYAVALKMQETAGNDYQGLSVGNGFGIKLDATQYTYEEDSFNKDYDAGAQLYTLVDTAEELQDALNKGENVRLLNDMQLTDDSLLTIAKGTNAAIDLNGHAITAKGTQAKATYLIKNDGNLTINDSTGNGKIELVSAVVSSNYGYATDAILNSGNLTINGGTIKNNLSGASYAIDNNVGGTATINGGTIVNTNGTAIRVYSWDANTPSNLTVNDGHIEGSYAVRLQNLSGSIAGKVNVEINGGVINGTNDWALYSYCNDGSAFNVTINGGTFNGYVGFGGGNKAGKENVTVTGGTFTSDPFRYVTSDKTETIYDAAEVAMDYAYAASPAALKNAFENENIKNISLTADVTVSGTVNVPAGKDVVLDLSGHDLSYAVTNSGAAAIISNKGALEITGEGTISFVAANPDLGAIPAYATNTITNTGTLTIGEGVIVTNGSEGGASYAVDNHGVFYLNGGTLIGDRCALRVAKYNQDNVVFVMNGGRVKAKTPAWIQLPGSNASDAPKISVTINGGTMQSTKATSADNDVMYTYSYGNSHANTEITINGGSFLGGTVSTGAGYKGDAPKLTINGGTFEYDVLQWLADGTSKVLYEAK
ncbi:MAG: hypothetical protein IJD39_04135 [Clostridia bacterium]|nr:hypothetical protein [Clostridia bacterium]